MAVGYILMGLVTMIMNIADLPKVLAVIMESAFDFQAMAGGFVGSA